MDVIINRNNYEAYFLLYADNELTPAERREVEAFIQLHPDLAAELNAVLQARFTPEPVTFSAKNLLYKTESATPVITTENCEEYFILYYDNELTAEEKKAVEQFVAENENVRENFLLLGSVQFTADEAVPFPEIAGLYRLPNGNSYTQLIDLVHNELPAQQAEQLQKEINGNRELEQEYQLLAQTVVRPDMNVRFPGIRSLYRKERKDTPVIPLWLRYAAAAAVFVFIAWMAFWRSGNSNNTTGNEALANKEKPAGTQPVNSKEPGVQPATTNTVGATSENNVATTNAPATIVKAPLNSSENKTGVVTSFSPERNNNTQAMQNVPGPEQNTAQQPVLVNNEKQPAVLPEKIKEIIETPQVTETVAGNRPQPETNGAAPEQMAGNENGIATGKTEEKDIASVSIAGLPADKIVEKSGLRGVGRKISRFFERKIKNSRNAISIGSFDVALAR